MGKIRLLQLQAQDALGIRAAEINKQLDQMSTCTNVFDVEAKMYHIMRLGERIAEIAQKYHEEMHVANSMPGEWHSDACLHGLSLDV